ncbi:ribonuclease E [Aliiruegeria haliotis]|uniref:Ribonuclease E n=1 Tax=Aliiruegeria haliotis TaxID=1280846 RepID=A0A2T0RZD5_9RHOB|nr:ribonuclease E/G [Aliiruegeria haliotis]PRY26492.1 ribonuclease E [Aliiruegeria haliotis]
MPKKMLIDATHAEETRVVVVDGNKVDEFDFETVNRRQLAGNIYLAKVTRVEPSLQAAFVDYGGNRHGFLAFSEIHPDYYQIPVADREALLAEERAMAAEEEDEPEEPKKSRSRSRRRSRSRDKDKQDNSEKTTSKTSETPTGDIEAMSVVDLGESDEASAPDLLVDDATAANPADTGNGGDASIEESKGEEAVAVADVDDTASEAAAEFAPAAETAADGSEDAPVEATAEEVAEADGATPEEETPTDAAEDGPAPEPETQPEDTPVEDVDADTTADASEDGEDEPRKGTIAARVEDDEDAVVTSEVDDAPEEGEAPAKAETETDATPDTATDDTAEVAPAAEDVAEAAHEVEAPEAAAEAEVAPEADADAVAEADGTEDSAETAAEAARAEASPETDEETPSDDESSDSEAAEADDSPAAGSEDGGEDESDDDDHPGRHIESVAEEDVAEEIRRPRKPRMRRYKIQEVIKVRQIMLVQVVKEERGNKGAALTTYLSLAGRYCVLMPNTARGGGISRKITNASDRKKLKEIAGEMDVPEGAGLIVRTAGAKRTKSEIKRDYEYLKRLWEQIRELTLKSIAPAPIYEEGNLIKRSIRDLYNREIDEVFVEGDAGYRVAKDFMKMIMPSHAKNVKHYQDSMPLFARYQVESYLAGMFNPTVQLKSGGYIVIGVTEALVAIDVNSGRATKEGSIEDTALKTNLEAAEEVARQLRLRDLAGLIVIDFIDMEERKNNSAVEKRFKDKLKTDRARIQVGRISGFGLLEMSRQRLRPGMLEATTQPCPACHGTGLLRSDDSIGLQILRQLEEEGGRARSKEVLVKAPVGICNFLMNQKREHVAQIEAQYGLSVRIEADPALVPPDFSIEKFKTATRWVPEPSAPVISIDTSDMPDVEEEEVAEAEVAEPETQESSDDGGSKKKRRRRRRRRGGGSGEDGAEAQDNSTTENSGDGDAAEAEAQPAENGSDEEGGKSKSRRRRRRSRRSNQSDEAGGEKQDGNDTPDGEVPAAAEAADAEATPDAGEPVAADADQGADVTAEAPAEEPSAPEAADETPEPSSPDATAAPEAEIEAPVEETVAEEVTEDHEPVAADTPEAEAPVSEDTEAEPEDIVEAEVAVAEVAPEPEPESPPKPKRRGWWSVGK